MIPHSHDHQRSSNRSLQRSWVEKCFDCTSCLELLWPRVFVHKWLNIPSKSSDYSADSDDGICDPVGADPFRFKDKKGDDSRRDPNGTFPRSRRRKSETFRAQYIEAKELRVSVNTWNVGGELPPEDLDITDWLDTDDPADIYAIGFQEIIPLNAGNIFGSEDTRPIPIWENIIRETLNKMQPVKTKFKCYSDPPSPSSFKPSEETPNIEDEIMLESDSMGEEEIYTFKEESNFTKQGDGAVGQNFSVTEDCEVKVEESIPNSFKSVNSLKASKSFEDYHPLESYLNGDNIVIPEVSRLAKLNLDTITYRKRRNQYVRIISKQMVGVFLTIWVRRSLRKHIQNVHVSTVGVGVMGYIGNKGSISVSMSIYQTPFCFVCTHLTSGERDIDNIKRNADVNEIYKRTSFNSMSKAALPRGIRDHERIIWFGDLNYRITLSYEETRDLISKNDWSKLLESDQLGLELREGRAFDGWREGTLNFPPTYKYELNSEKYVGENTEIGKRIPSWCDRILSLGSGIRQLSYKRAELRLSDHRPVSALYLIEVEVFSLRKLRRALTFTDIKIENYGVIAQDALECDH